MPCCPLKTDLNPSDLPGVGASSDFIGVLKWGSKTRGKVALVTSSIGFTLYEVDHEVLISIIRRHPFRIRDMVRKHSPRRCRLGEPEGPISGFDSESGPTRIFGQLKTWRTFQIVFIFAARERGRGSLRRREEGGSLFLLTIPGRGAEIPTKRSRIRHVPKK